MVLVSLFSALFKLVEVEMDGQKARIPLLNTPTPIGLLVFTVKKATKKTKDGEKETPQFHPKKLPLNIQCVGQYSLSLIYQGKEDKKEKIKNTNPTRPT